MRKKKMCHGNDPGGGDGWKCTGYCSLPSFLGTTPEFIISICLPLLAQSLSVCACVMCEACIIRLPFSTAQSFAFWQCRPFVRDVRDASNTPHWLVTPYYAIYFCHVSHITMRVPFRIFLVLGITIRQYIHACSVYQEKQGLLLLVCLAPTNYRVKDARKPVHGGFATTASKAWTRHSKNITRYVVTVPPPEQFQKQYSSDNTNRPSMEGRKGGVSTCELVASDKTEAI